MRAVVALLIVTAAAASPATRPVRVDDFSRFQDVADPQMSPDGAWVLYTVTSTDAAKDRRNTDIWTVKWDGSQRRQITYGAENETSPRWSPDGSSISFLASRPGSKGRGNQVWVLDRRGGESHQITELPGRISSFDWSPDGRRLALVYREADAADPEPVREGATPPPPKPIVIDKYQFKRDGQGYLTGETRTRIYLYDVASRTLDALTGDGDFEESNPEWSPDGKRIAFVSNHDRDWQRTRNTDVFVADATGGSKSRQLTTSPGADGGSLVWTPDGTLIVFGQGSEPKFDFHNLTRLAVAPAAGGAARLLTPQLDRGVSSPAVSEDGRFVVFTVADDRTQYLARVPVAGGSIERIVDGARVVTQPSRANGHIAVLSSADSGPAEVFAVEPSGLRQLTTHNDALLAELDLVPSEDVSFRSKDGTDVHALLTKPVGYVAGRRYPTLVRLHGGPTGQDTHGFVFERQLFAAHGYVVLNVNYRGSSGRGANFSESIFADWGNLEVDGVLAAVDDAVAKGIADPQRLGIGGWSYGGVLTDYVIAKDTRFKAAISGAGSANHISLYGHDQYT
ncbi:MAG: S9 family peptidase, partial [Vicinamibacterales bacterium]